MLNELTVEEKSKLGVRWLLILGGLALLAGAELLINVARWYDWELSRFTFLHRWGCRVVPATCSSLRLPHFFVPAVAAAIIGTGMFLVARHLANHSPLLRDLPAKDLRNLKGLMKYCRLSLAAISLGLLVELIGLGIALTGRLVPPWLWAGGLLVMVAGLTYEEQQSDDLSLLRRRDLIYLIGILALLVSAAGVGGGRWVLAVLSGLLSTFILSWSINRSWDDLDWRARAEWIAVPLIALLAFALASYGLMSWRWSLIGDEYEFFNLARSIVEGTHTQPVLSGTGAYGYHPLISSYWQALTMKLFGVNSYGWRVASPLLVGLSVLPLYYFARESSSRTIALVAVTVFAGSHYLMTFAKIGYNNVQALIPLTLSLGLFVLARRRGSILGFFLVGMALGTGFYTYALARLAMVPIALLFLLYYPPYRKRSWYLYAITALGFILVVYPVALDREAWQGQASKSILQSEVADTLYDRVIQVRNNVFYGAVAFMSHSGNSHFVFGAHLDPMSGLLFLIGLGIILRHLFASRIHLAWFLIYASLLVVTSGFQRYAYPNNAWLWFNIPIYSMFIAVGCCALAQDLASLLRRANWAYAVSSVLVLVMLSLNFWLSVDLSQEKTTKNKLAFVLETAQNVGDRDGRGPTLHVVGREDFHRPLMSYMFTAYEIPWQRFTLHYYPTDVEQTTEQLCDERGSSEILLVSADYPNREVVRRRMQKCWPEARVQRLVDGTGTLHFLRFMTPAASAQASDETLAQFPQVTPEPAPVVTSGDRIRTQLWQVYEPRDVAVAPDGQVAAIDGVTGRVILFDSDGEATLAVDAGLKDPSAIAFDPEGLLVVLDSGEGNAVVYITSDGKVQRRIGSTAGFYSPRGLDIAPDRRIYVADTGQGRIVALTFEGQVLTQFQGGAALSQPTDVAVLPDGRLLVTDPIIPALYMISTDDRVLWDLPLAPSNTVEAPKVALSTEGWLVVSDPGMGRILRVNLGGRVLEEWTGLVKPTGVTVGEDGTVYVAEAGSDQISRRRPAR